MNRYGRGSSTIGAPSKAAASTQCQKCLKRDIYECKAIVQERPYVSRPSRTQQLQNPKLIPKLTQDVPQDLLRKKGIADEQLAKAEQERGRKRDRQNEDVEGHGKSKRMRSASSHSVSTISTNLSRTPPPRRSPSREPIRHKLRSMSLSESPEPSRPDTRRPKSPSTSKTPPPPNRRNTNSDRKRARESFSSAESDFVDERRSSRDRADGRSTRRRYREASPPVRGRRTESRSPYRGRRRLSHDRQDPRNLSINEPMLQRTQPKARPRERSLSPFSKRLALTQAMNMSR